MGNSQRESKDDFDLNTPYRGDGLMTPAPKAEDEFRRHLMDHVYGQVLVSKDDSNAPHTERGYTNRNRLLSHKNVKGKIKLQVDQNLAHTGKVIVSKKEFKTR